MERRARSLHDKARLAAGLLMASALSLGTVASASAQTLAIDPARQPVQIGTIGAGAAPRLTKKGITLEQAIAAARVLSGQGRGVTIEQAIAAPERVIGSATEAALAPSAVIGGGAVTAVFIPSAAILAV